MNETIYKWTALETIICYKCGITFAVPDSYRARRLEDQQTFWCPNGHSQHYTKSITATLENELKKANARLTAAREDADRQRALKEKEVRRVYAYRGVVSKIRKRVGRGVCPCCNRSFEKLQRHMETKHPKYKNPKDAA